MTFPPFPAQNSGDWYAWAQAVDGAARNGGSGTGAPIFNVRDPQFAGGAKGDDGTDDAPAIQAAIAAALAAGGGTVYFPPANPGLTYRYSQIVIDDVGLTNRYVFLALVGDDSGVMLRPLRGPTTPSVVIQASGATANGSNQNQFIENVTLRNLNFTNGYLNSAQTSDTNRIGIQVSHAQNLILDNVTIQGFWKQGLQLLSVEDSKIVGLNILWCGHATSDTDYAYALELDTYSAGEDGCNALEFTDFHIDQCPLEVHIASSAVAPMSFMNGKMERQVYTDTTGLSRILLEDSFQVEFTNVHVFEDQPTDKYAIRATTADSTWMTATNQRRHLKFVNCTFGAASATGIMSRWAIGNYLTFDDCTFMRVDGTNSAGAFTLGNGSKITNCEITLSTNDINVFGITGPNVVIRDVLVQNSSTTTSAGNLFTFTAAYDGVVVDNIGLVGFFGSVISGASPSYLGNGRYSRPQTGATREASTGASTFLADQVNLNPSAATNFRGTSFPHGHNGKRVVLYALNGNSTLVHDATALYLKGAANRTLTTGATVQLHNDSGIWREV